MASTKILISLGWLMVTLCSILCTNTGVYASQHLRGENTDLEEIPSTQSHREVSYTLLLQIPPPSLEEPYCLYTIDNFIF
jgi:hypothetical protein